MQWTVWATCRSTIGWCQLKHSTGAMLSRVGHLFHHHCSRKARRSEAVEIHCETMRELLDHFFGRLWCNLGTLLHCTLYTYINIHSSYIPLNCLKPFSGMGSSWACLAQVSHSQLGCDKAHWIVAVQTVQMCAHGRAGCSGGLMMKDSRKWNPLNLHNGPTSNNQFKLKIWHILKCYS